MADDKKDALSFYEDVANLTKLCNFLRSNEGPPVREAVEMDKRVYYLKGKQKRRFATPMQGVVIYSGLHRLTCCLSLFQVKSSLTF